MDMDIIIIVRFILRNVVISNVIGIGVVGNN